MSGRNPRIQLAKMKRLFLIDGLGAIASSIFLGFIFVKYQDNIGMPKNVLYPLALVAGLFATYSLSNLANYKPNNISLKVIGMLNLLYSFVTCALVILHFERLTFLGLAYFIGEILILWILVFYELRDKTYKNELGEK